MLCTEGCAVARIAPDGHVDCLAVGNAGVVRAADGAVKVSGVVNEVTWAGVATSIITSAAAAYAIGAAH